MGNRRKTIDDEPAWKRRQKEMRAETRKKLLWKIGGALAAAAVVTLIAWSAVRSLSPRPNKKNAKVQIYHSIGRIVDKTVVREEGKTRRILRFQLGAWKVDKEVDEPTFDSVQTNKGDLRVSFYYEPDSRTPKIQDWQPVKYAPGKGK